MASSTMITENSIGDACLMKIGDSNFLTQPCQFDVFETILDLNAFHRINTNIHSSVYIVSQPFQTDLSSLTPCLESKASVISLQVKKHLRKDLFSPLGLILEENSHEMPFNFQSKI